MASNMDGFSFHTMIRILLRSHKLSLDWELFCILVHCHWSFLIHYPFVGYFMTLKGKWLVEGFKGYQSWSGFKYLVIVFSFLIAPVLCNLSDLVNMQSIDLLFPFLQLQFRLSELLNKIFVESWWNGELRG